MRTALIDADVLVYSSALSTEHPVDWGDDLWTLHADFSETQLAFNESVERIKQALSADSVVLALSDYTDPWRKKIHPEYKSNRKKVRRPVTFAAVREWASTFYTTYQRQGLEGDDILGILLTHPEIIPGEKVCVSIDKDMSTLPGLHFNMDKPLLGIREVTEAAADLYHMQQTISGDSTDGYKGCPGVGEKRAARALENRGDRPMWDVVVETYKNAGLSEEVALMNARVARICRHQDYDFTKKEVRLWNPPIGKNQ